MAHARNPTMTQLETFIATQLNHIHNFFTGTVMEYWLLDAQGQAKTLFFALIVGLSSWFLALEYASRKTKKAARQELVQPDMAESSSAPSSPASPDDTGGDGNFMQELAPPGHRPTNADLTGYSQRAATLKAVDEWVRANRPAESAGSEKENEVVAVWANVVGKKGGRAVLVKKKKEVVAVWANEVGKKGGRAVLVQ